MKKTIAIFTSAALIFSGCASYNATSLVNLSSDVYRTSSSEDGEIVVAAKAFTEKDCKKYLDRKVIAKGYQPVQISIENHSNKYFSFSPNEVSLKNVSSEEVAKKVHGLTAIKAVGYGAMGILITPLVMATAMSGAGPMALLLYAIPPVPAFASGVQSSKANAAIDRDFSSKTVAQEVIQPYSSFNKVIFVPVDEYRDDFSITLINQENNTKKEIELIAN